MIPPIIADYGKKTMAEDKDILKEITSQEYEHGFVTDVEQEFIPKGLDEDIIRLISSKKDEPQWLLDFRLDAFRKWQKMKMPSWAHLDIPQIDFQDIIYFGPEKRQTGPYRPGAGSYVRETGNPAS